MKRKARPGKTPSALRVSVYERLNAYAIAAGAAGVSMLALGQTANAEIVYTPANEVIGRSGSYNLDVNHDGIVDFMITERPGATQFRTSQGLWARAGMANQVECSSTFCASSARYPVALSLGSQIGPRVRGRGWMGRSAGMAFEELNKHGTLLYGCPWANVSDRYLGLKLKINGEFHYGWARFTVKFHGGPPAERTWEAHLTGYAYETVADKSILAGQTKSSDNGSDNGSESDASLRRTPDAIQLAALGKLALGSDGIAFWRREPS